MTHRFKLIVFLTALPVFFVLISPGRADSPPIVDRAGGPDNHIAVVLQADKAPKLGGVTTLTFEASPLLDAPDLEIRWDLPPGVTLLGGPMVESLGMVPAGESVRLQRQVRLDAPGTHRVAVSASYRPHAAAQFAASGVLFFTVGARAASASDRDPHAFSPMGTTMSCTTSAVASQPPVAPGAVAGDPCFTVEGTFIRVDKPPTPTGYAPDVLVWVNRATVIVRESDLLFDDNYVEFTPGPDGHFSYRFCDDDGWFDDTLEIYVRLRADARSARQVVAEVEDTSFFDEVYEFDTPILSSSGGTLNFYCELDQNQSAIINILDTLYDAWQFWNDNGGAASDDRIFDYTAETHWEPGYGETNTYYNSGWDELTISDDPSDPDQWDDSVIIHEWGHLADDKYGCDNNPGDPHVFSRLYHPELAFGEGYPDYYQSAVRNSQFYIDHPGSGSFSVDLETWDVTITNSVSVRNEIAVAATLWDFFDTANDGQDTISHGHAMIQEVYTRDWFIDNDAWDDDCDLPTYMTYWRALGKPTDAQTAAVVQQNTNVSNIFSVRSALGVNSATSASSPDSDEKYRWWERVLFVVDNSASMANAGKFDAVKTVLQEQVNDLSAEPQGVEFNLQTFNNTSWSNQPVFAGQFFANAVTPVIDALTTSGTSDSNCKVDAFNALANALQGVAGADVWLFTDGDTWTDLPTVDNMQAILTESGSSASFALLGLCPPSLSGSPLAGLEGLAERPEHVEARSHRHPERSTEHSRRRAVEAASARQFRHALRPYLALAPKDPPGGVVPYLLTAIASGGQLLYVDESQLDAAADILHAQLSHSAGAGRWSDYVSDWTTYRWDELASWEYDWIDARNGGGSYWGKPGGFDSEGYLLIYLPDYLSFYGDYLDEVYVFENGYVTFGDPYGLVANNTALPNPASPNRVLYPYWDDLEWYNPFRNPDDLDEGGIYTQQVGDWFAIEFYKYRSTTSQPPNTNTEVFEVQLNMESGEIRYLYDTISNDVGGATIGLEDGVGTSDAVQISHNDVDGASSGMGYHFTPVPPQSTKTYYVPVDSTMESVGFLLTGFSGSFDPLLVRTPDNTVVDCGDAGVLCLTLDLVQYVQVNVDGRVGDWQVEVGAGTGGYGTFAFTSMAVSPLAAKSSTPRNLPTVGGEPLLVDLGQPMDGDTLTGWFHRPDYSLFGSTFTLYDDGAHGDGDARDGLFGSVPYTPPEAGTAYLWVQGFLDGESIIRSDPVPFSFQPLRLVPLADEVANTGPDTQLDFVLTNDDVYDHCYDIDVRAPDGWYWSYPGTQCLSPGGVGYFSVWVNLTSELINDKPSGTSGVVTVVAIETEKGIISASASTHVTRHRPPARIQVHNPSTYVRPDGDTAPLRFYVLDEEDSPVADGTELQFGVTLGSLPMTTTVQNGNVVVAFISGPAEGEALITAQTSNGVSTTTTVLIAAPQPDRIELTLSTDQLPANGSSTATLTAIAYDPWGDPVAGQTVRIGVEGDGQMGTVGGGEVVSGTTDASGQFVATYTSGVTPGEAWLRAELLIMEVDRYVLVQADRQVIRLGEKVYLPLILKY